MLNEGMVFHVYRLTQYFGINVKRSGIINKNIYGWIVIIEFTTLRFTTVSNRTDYSQGKWTNSLPSDPFLVLLLRCSSSCTLRFRFPARINTIALSDWPSRFLAPPPPPVHRPHRPISYRIPRRRRRLIRSAAPRSRDDDPTFMPNDRPTDGPTEHPTGAVRNCHLCKV